MKRRADSFASRLTPAQRDELFALLAGGKGLRDGAAYAFACYKAEFGGRPPLDSAVSSWFASERVERRYAAAKAVALSAQASCPDDYDEQARRAIGQQRFLAALGELSPKDLASLEKNQIAREKLALDREKLAQDNRVARLSLALDRARLLLERVRGGEKGGDLQQQIAFALEEIERMKRGEEPAQ